MEKRAIENSFLWAGIGASVFSSIAWVTEQEAVLRLSPITVSAMSPLIAAVLMYPYVARNHHFPTRKQIKELWRYFVLVFLLRNIFCFLIFTYALTMTSSAKVMFLTKIEPYLVLFLHWVLYQERASRRDLALLAWHIAGAILLSTGGEISFHLEHAGDLLVFVGILAHAFVYRPSQILSETWGSGVTGVLTNFTGGVILLPFALYFSHKDFSLAEQQATGFVYVLLTVALYYILSSTLWFYSLKGVRPWLNSALRCIGPIIAAPLAWWFFDKSLTFLQLVGAGVVVFTSALLVKNSKDESLS